MSWLHNIRMAPKLIGSFVLVAILAGVVGGAGVLGMASMQAKTETLTANTFPGLIYLWQAKFDIAQTVRYTRGAIIATTPAKVAGYAAKAQANRNAALQAFSQYQRLPYDSAQEAAEASGVLGQFQRWRPISERIQQLACFIHGVERRQREVARGGGWDGCSPSAGGRR